jgi:DUF971 family protein
MEPETIQIGAEVPSDVTVSRDMRALTLNWEQGDSSTIPAEKLRLACWCAWCRVERIKGLFPDRFEGVEIQQVKALGGYAVHIGFSDGHARGIFPWSYLKDVALGRAPPDPERECVALSRQFIGSSEAAVMAPASDKASQ